MKTIKQIFHFLLTLLNLSAVSKRDNSNQCNMDRIGLLEIQSKNHALSGLCKNSNTKNNKVTVFTTPSIFSYVKDELKGNISEYEWILIDENESVLSFLKKVERICTDRIDLLVVNTLRKWQFLFFNPRCKKIFIPRNLNWWYQDTKSLRIHFNKIKEMHNIFIKYPMFNCITGPVIRKLIICRYDGVIVEYPPFNKYIRDNFNYKKRIYFFPHMAFENVPPQKRGDTVVFVVPGMVQKKRRDYNTILKVFEDLVSKYKESVELYLLGKPVGDSGHEVLFFCKKLKEKGYKIYYFKEYVSPEIFEEILYRADIILSPMKMNFKLRWYGIEETYTVTKGTGTFTNSIKYAKPVIVPKYYNVAEEINTSYLKYRDEFDLRDILENLICNREELEYLKKEALKNARKFSLEKIHSAFDKMVNDFLC